MSYTSELTWPARAVVTAGMPYGNKKLHFGHVAGVFVPADAYARFLRDRIGEQNVLFVSGTDCFGSPIQEGYRKACENEGFEGTATTMRRRRRSMLTISRFPSTRVRALAARAKCISA